MGYIFRANVPLKGKRLVEVTGFKTKKDWARFVKRIADEMHPTAKKIRLVMDPFNADQFFLFNVAVGGNWPEYPDGTTNLPQRMFVDYLRVFQ